MRGSSWATTIWFISCLSKCKGSHQVSLQPIAPHHDLAVPEATIPTRSVSLLEVHELESLLKFHHDNTNKDRPRFVISERDGTPRPQDFLSRKRKTDVQSDLLKIKDLVIPMSDLKHTHFIGKVNVGTPPQTLELIFDTGSTNIQVVGTSCVVPSCLKVKRFDPSASKTFSYVGSPTVGMDITFGTGRIHSLLGTDVVSIGAYTVRNQTLGIIDNEKGDAGPHGNIFDRMKFEGIVGFGFPSMASTKSQPFFDRIMQQGAGQANVFAIYMSKRPGTLMSLSEGLSRDNNAHQFGGLIESETGESNTDESGIGVSMSDGLSGRESVSAFFIGGVDPMFFFPPIRYVPVVKEHYWEIALKGFYVGDVKFCCDEETENFAIIDSGTTYNTLPHHEIDKFLALVPPRECGSDIASLDTYPTLRYILDNGVELVFPPESYILRTKLTSPQSESSSVCRPAFMQIDVPRQFGHAYILGSIVYMQHYFTVFKRSLDPGEPSQVGIAKARHTTDGASFLENIAGDYS